MEEAIAVCGECRGVRGRWRVDEDHVLEARGGRRRVVIRGHGACSQSHRAVCGGDFKRRVVGEGKAAIGARSNGWNLKGVDDVRHTGSQWG